MRPPILPRSRRTAPTAPAPARQPCLNPPVQGVPLETNHPWLLGPNKAGRRPFGHVSCRSPHKRAHDRPTTAAWTPGRPRLTLAPSPAQTRSVESRGRANRPMKDIEAQTVRPTPPLAPPLKVLWWHSLRTSTWTTA